ncbi:hypothetical protein B6U99_03830 [Candidatus Geothermarchaeota archaeon ex4572_27]|nr:MAG: hypothetical protein B6U99_03830 [Candidatus Geothermarchaeota archaeon ex4572_27]
MDLERAKRVMAMLKRGKPRSIAAAALYLTTGLTQKEITTITGVSRYTISEIISKNLKTKKAKFQKFKNIRI